MKLTARHGVIVASLTVFIGLPLMFYALGVAPRRSVLKESLSVLTLLAISMLLAQYFLARSNEMLLNMFEPQQIQKAHKLIAYSAVGVILLHPALVVLPRCFEAGVKPWDAFVTLITSFDRLGVVLGLVAWALLLVLSVSAYFRGRLVPRFRNSYRGWRYFHGGLAVTLTLFALWHAIELGRHTDIAMAAFLITLALAGFALLARLYWGAQQKKPLTNPISEGAAT